MFLRKLDKTLDGIPVKLKINLFECLPYRAPIAMQYNIANRTWLKIL